MKKNIFSAVLMITFLTAAQPILAQEGSSTLKLDDAGPERIRDFNPRVNPQLGLSSFEHSKQSGSRNSTAFGVTTELGQTEMRKLETGLLVLQTGSDAAAATYLTIPMMAKLRILAGKAQSWYGKFGFAPAFELSSTNKRATNNIDVLMAAGIAGRLVFTKDMDFIVDATYNRGLMDNVRGGGDNRNQGVLVLGGVSIRI
jgi:hypothetical protein